MEPIISPWFFYFADVADAVDILSSLLSLGLIATSSFMFLEEVSTEYGGLSKDLRKTSKKLFMLGVILALIALFTPDSSTIYKMGIARQITPNNIEQLSNATDKAVDTLIDKIIKAEKEMRKRNLN